MRNYKNIIQNIKLIQSIINCTRSYFSHHDIKLGRWTIIYNEKQIEKRVKRSNEDHSF